MEEKILAAFEALGFEMEPLSTVGYGFEYEGKHYLYLHSNDDEDFLSISIPAVYDKDDSTPEVFSALVDKINETAKYVKAYTMDHYIWLFYERELMGDDDLERTIQRMVLRLDHIYNTFHSSLRKLEDFTEAEEVTDNDDAQDTNTNEEE